DMGKALANAQAIGLALDAFALLVHHTGKDPKLGMRGSSALFANADAVIFVEREKDSNVSVATATKSRDGDPALGRFAFGAVQVLLGLDEDGDAVTSCIVEQREIP